MRHMDWFGTTLMSNLMHKKYELVVTNDYSRYAWVFFLGDKDETASILKKFITEIENLVDKKVMDEAANTACYVQNRVLVVKPHNKTLNELIRVRTHALSFMRPFRCHVTIINTLDYLGKFDGKCDEGFFVGYSLNSKVFRVYNNRTRKVEENLHVRFLEDKPIIVGNGPKWTFDIDMLTKSMNYVTVIAGTNSNDFADASSLFGSSSKNSDDAGSPPFGDAKKKLDEVSNKETGASNKLNYAFENLNTEYPDDSQIPGLETIPTYDDSAEEVDFTNLETSILVNPTPTTRIYKNHPLKQMDVKSSFLYERIKEEVYMCQPLRFEYPNHPNKVYKVVKTLYGLHQAPRAWKELCTEFKRLVKDSQDKYVDEVLRKFNFSDLKSASTLVDTKKTLVKDKDGDDVDVHLYRSIIGSLMYLITSRPDIIDYAGESLDRKSTFGGCWFLGSRLISWQCKKKIMVATFITEAEYVAAASCCGQVLWIQN
nr:ribonuclease H-like domain-containing protein [Tanacetum cinerariifolium]